MSFVCPGNKVTNAGSGVKSTPGCAVPWFWVNAMRMVSVVAPLRSMINPEALQPSTTFVSENELPELVERERVMVGSWKDRAPKKTAEFNEPSATSAMIILMV